MGRPTAGRGRAAGGDLDTQNVAESPLPEDPAAGQARDLVRAQLTDCDLADEELITTSELLVSELVGNVIRHACGPIQLPMPAAAH